MLLVLWLHVISFEEPSLTIQVENNGRYLDRIAFGRVRVCRDGSFLANTFHHVWHWDSDGKLIGMFGGRGQGPDEFQAISEVMYTDGYYWVIDGARAVSKIFDGNGVFLYERPTPYRQFINAGDRLFIVDRRGFSPDPVKYPPVLQEIEYKITPNQLSISNGSLLFKKVTRRQMEMLINFKQSWIVPFKDGFLVMDQLEPIIRIYDANALEIERNKPIDEPWDPDLIATPLKGWVDPPDSMLKDFQNNKTMLRWWQSWSRINYFAAAGDDLVVGYEIPDPDYPEDSIQAIQRIGYDGKPIGEPVFVAGRCMGMKDDMIWVFNADESDSVAYRYFVKAYSF